MLPFAVKILQMSPTQGIDFLSLWCRMSTWTKISKYRQHSSAKHWKKKKSLVAATNEMALLSSVTAARNIKKWQHLETSNQNRVIPPAAQHSLCQQCHLMRKGQKPAHHSAHEEQENSYAQATSADVSQSCLELLWMSKSKATKKSCLPRTFAHKTRWFREERDELLVETSQRKMNPWRLVHSSSCRTGLKLWRSTWVQSNTALVTWLKNGCGEQDAKTQNRSVPKCISDNSAQSLLRKHREKLIPGP